MTINVEAILAAIGACLLVGTMWFAAVVLG